MNGQHRPLTQQEIERLTSGGCVADDWDHITVGEGFDAAFVRNVIFTGRISVGATGRKVTTHDGFETFSGIYNSAISDCRIGDGVYISNTGTVIRSCDIADGAFIENTGKIICTGRSMFGNGVRVSAVNENGGRAVIITDRLTAQTAYIYAMYRHLPGLTEQLDRISIAYSEKVSASRGYIGPATVISGCGEIIDCRIGGGATLRGVSRLANGTIASNADSKTFIGAGVTARDFIVLDGSTIDRNTAIERCFVGQSCILDNGFAATDSLFFADCDMGCGEACSIFAGPYTVSHHRSSLLIAGYFLFFNAGSGANQSNHLFKTGAVHQGIHERGCKFASNAYIMLPAREGAFNVVLGRHSSHHDTSDFPFSYLVEENGASYLLPGMNLRSYGTMRDMAKWPARDRRKKDKRDITDFDEYNPYIGMRLLCGIGRLEKICESDKAEHAVGRTRIKSTMARKGLQLYNLALDATIGTILEQDNARSIWNRLKEAKCEKTGSDNAFDQDSTSACIGGQWCDIAGMYAPQRKIELLAERIEKGELTSPDNIAEAFAEIHSEYNADSVSWAVSVLQFRLGRRPSETDRAEAVARAEAARQELDRMRSDDGTRDRSASMATGYGIDSRSDDDKMSDFEHTR